MYVKSKKNKGETQMKIKLILKRTLTAPNRKTEMKVVTVDVPVNPEDGWALASWCDSIEVDEEVKQQTVVKEVQPGEKYPSSITGGARLIRIKDTIKIAFRKGKTTFNENGPNSVCISEADKQLFFDDVKYIYGLSPTFWRLLPSDDPFYSKWNKLIDTLYEEGRIEFNKKQQETLSKI